MFNNINNFTVSPNLYNLASKWSLLSRHKDFGVMYIIFEAFFATKLETTTRFILTYPWNRNTIYIFTIITRVWYLNERISKNTKENKNEKHFTINY